MIRYYARLAVLSLRQTPLLTGLMVGTIGVGIGVFMAALTVYYLMANNPISWKSERLYAVQLDSWDPAEPWDDERPELAPWELTWRDAMALRESDLPLRQAAMYKVSIVVQSEREGVKPFQTEARVTDGNFFALFDIPFVYGSAWDRAVDDAGQFQVVISRKMNEELFGGEDSVGRTVRIQDKPFVVAGVTETWNPVPKFYDVNNGPFDDAEEVFVPMGVGRALELYSAGNTNCWKDEEVRTYQQFLESECVWWQYWVELPDVAQRDAYQDYLDQYVSEQKTLGRFPRPLNNQLSNVAEWLDVRQVVRRDNQVLVVLSFLFLGVCLFNTIGLMLTKFLGKAPHIGIRRALGASRAAVFRQQLVEVGAIGVAGGIAGLCLAWLSLAGIRKLFPGYEELAQLDLTLVGTAIAASILTTLVAGLYPVRRVCATAPARYLRLQ